MTRAGWYRQQAEYNGRYAAIWASHHSNSDTAYEFARLAAHFGLATQDEERESRFPKNRSLVKRLEDESKYFHLIAHLHRREDGDY